MDLEHLRALVLVAHHGSVRKAAEASSWSRTTLRRHLDELEQGLGVTLLDRDELGVRATRAGADVIERATALLAAADELFRAPPAVASEPEGRIRVFFPIGLPRRAQVGLILHHRSANPRLLLDGVEVIDPLAHCDEPFDLILHFGPPPEQGRWFSRVLRRANLRLFASPAYLEASGTPGTVAELGAHALLHWQPTGRDPEIWPVRGGGELPVAPWFRSPNLGLVLELAAAGGGIVLAPDDVIDVDPLAGPLVPVLEDAVGGDVAFRVLSPHPSDADPRTREMLVAVQALLADLPTD